VEKTHHSTLLIFTPEITPRVEFTFELIFKTILGIDLIFTKNSDEFLQSDLPKINYSQTNLSSGLFLKANDLLFQKNISNQETDVVEYQEMKLFFPTSGDSFLPFDPFAIISTIGFWCRPRRTRIFSESVKRSCSSVLSDRYSSYLETR
jgi:hypothetical protein